MSVKMMPPKKSKAARSDNLDANTEEKPAECAPPERPLPAADSDEEPMTGVPPKKKPFNIFDITTVEGKRKRNVFSPEAALNDWIDEYFEEKADVKLNLGEVYNIYLAKCVDEASNALEDNLFNKVMRQKFPNGFSLKPNSPYGDRLKEKKVKKKEPKVKADTLSIKIRDIIENTLRELGNPRGGVRFGKLVTHIAGKYPALRIEMRPKMLLAALQRGVRYGYLTLFKGIGKCGYYRLYVADEPSEDEEDDKKKDEKKDDKKKDDEKTDGEEKNGDEKDGEKSADESTDESKEKDIKTEDGKDDSKDKENEKGATKKKAKKWVPRERFIHHGDPARVEDTFYLAMTFMSEPKEASVQRIKKYIGEHYADANVDRVARCLDTGKERGYWEQTSGTSGTGGKFRLEVDSFDPTDDEDMTGMVINAIMACTEPKMCSAHLLKKYVMEWYADKFKVAERPHLFKKAIDRAVANQEIKQLSGIGATGTFQLAKPFFPSPAILAGQDTPSDYEQDSEDTSDEEAVESYDFSGYGDKYKPRPSKRRGMARSKAVHAKPAVEVHEEPQKRKRKASRKAAQKARKRSRQDSSSEEESSDESSDESDNESEEEAPPPKKRGAPKKREAPAAKKRAAPAAKKAPAKKAATKKAPVKKEAPEPKGRSRARVNYADSSSDDGSDDEKVVDGYKPTPSRSRGGESARTPVSPPPKKKTPKKNTPAKKSPKKEPKLEPEPETPSRRVRTVAAKKQGDDIRYNEDSDSPDSIDSEPRARRVETPAAKKQRSATAPKSRGRRK